MISKKLHSKWLFVGILIAFSSFFVVTVAKANTKKILSAIDASGAGCEEISKKIHQFAERRYEEIKSSALLMAELEKIGYKVKADLKAPKGTNFDMNLLANQYKPLHEALTTGIFRTAFRAELTGKDPGPTITIMLEYDALPNGHSCGHNLIATSGLMAAQGLASVMAETPGKIVVIGTPAEEVGTFGGKLFLLDAGHFEGSDIVLITHPGTHWNTTDKLLSAKTADLVFKGKASHAAASPHKGVNALNAVMLTFDCVDKMRGHLRQDVRIHGVVSKGGEARNIVTEYAKADFSIRALDVPTMEDAYQKVINCARAGALGTGAILEFTPPPYALLSPIDTSLQLLVLDKVRSLGIADTDIKASDDFGSSDLGNVGHAYPTVNLRFKAVPEGIAGHSDAFRDAVIMPEAFKATVLAGKALALTAYELLTQPEKVKAIKTQFMQNKEKEKK